MSSSYDWSLIAANNSNSDGAINWSEGQAPSTVNNSARQQMARNREILTDLGGSIAAGGTANGLTVTAASALTALADGLIVSFRATASNTAAATLNVNGIGAKAIQKMGSSGDTALAANDIRDTGIYVVQYSAALNGAAGAWLLLNPTTAVTSITPPSAQVFSANGTWNKPTGCTRIVIEACGGGGGAGGVNGINVTESGATGGGGGGFSGATIPLDVSAVASAAVTIGAAGTAGDLNTNGGNGGNTSITIGATTYTWGGGSGSTFLTAVSSMGTVSGGAGGVGTNVVGYSIPGFPGIRGNNNPNADNNAASGAGGSSMFGTGGASVRRTSAGNTNGNNGVGFGAGGSGGANVASGADANGGAGTGGYMRIWEYYS